MGIDAEIYVRPQPSERHQEEFYQKFPGLSLRMTTRSDLGESAEVGPLGRFWDPSYRRGPWLLYRDIMLFWIGRSYKVHYGSDVHDGPPSFFGGDSIEAFHLEYCEDLGVIFSEDGTPLRPLIGDSVDLYTMMRTFIGEVKNLHHGEIYELEDGTQVPWSEVRAWRRKENG